MSLETNQCSFTTPRRVTRGSRVKKQIQPMEFQHLSPRFIRELNGTGPGTIVRFVRVGHQGRALRFASLVLRGRQRSARQAHMLLRKVGQTMAANRDCVVPTRLISKARNPAVFDTG